jgi:hypothetical protein
MNDTDRVELLARLAAGRAELLAAVEGMSDPEALASVEDRWSAIGNIEHLTIVEANLMRGIVGSEEGGEAAEVGKELRLFEAVKSRRRKVSAPAPALPPGKCRTVAEAMAKFDAVRAETVRFVEGCGKDLRRCGTTHPLLGPLSAMECIHLVAAHPFRHAAQIRESRGQISG